MFLSERNFQTKGLLESLSLLLPMSLFYAVWLLADFFILINIEFSKSPTMIALLLLMGYLSWTFCEYIAHRYIEHRPMSGRKSPKWLIDWFPHVDHHQQPQNLNDIFEIHQSSLIIVFLIFFLFHK